MSHIYCRQCGQRVEISEHPGRDSVSCLACGFENRLPDALGAAVPTPARGDPLAPAAPPRPGDLPDDPFMRPPWYAEPAEAQPAINPYAPPSDPTGGVVVQMRQWSLASRWQRLGGKLVDQFLLPLAWIIVCGIVGAFLLPLGVDQIPWLQVVLVGIYFMGFLAVPVVNWYLIVKDGQTIGKKMVGTRIVIEHTGQIPTFFEGVIMRNWVPNLLMAVPLLGAIFALVNALFIFGDKRQCLHDLFAGTRVVQAG